MEHTATAKIVQKKRHHRGRYTVSARQSALDISLISESDMDTMHNKTQEEVMEETDNDFVILEAQRRERVPCEDWLDHWLH